MKLPDASVVRHHPLFFDLDQETFEAFRTHHRANPAIWELFAEYAKKIQQAGHKKYSAKAIMERVRWHYDEQKGPAVDGFIINNSFTSYYARLLVVADPSFKDFFDFRSTKGLKEAA